jgi:two-component system chemotaxis sensor kinase CheA
VHDDGTPAPSNAADPAPAQAGFGFFDDPAAEAAPRAPTQPRAERIERDSRRKTGDGASIRVALEKVDRLINLVGEVVIAQSMLARTAERYDAAHDAALTSTVEKLARHTRDLRESVMSIRMLPMSAIFGRFPRLVRDAAATLGKEVDLRLEGEDVELDKGIIEQLADPLTHLVRNAIDHGLETGDERVALGKPRRGTVTLRARHHSGNVILDVIDDGRGLSRERILAKALERGINLDESAPDADVWQCIFEAGFSTSAEVTELSGRGVGMDVVKRNISALGGRVDLDSTPGAGTRIAIRLPLTMAILDGLSVAVGEQRYIVPLANVIESLQPAHGDVKTIAAQGEIVYFRGVPLAVERLHRRFGIHGATERPEDGILVVLENDGRRGALLVDALESQEQVVIKSLESNFRRVAGIAGATVMGDGRVALILDVAGLVA